MEPTSSCDSARAQPSLDLQEAIRRRAEEIYIRNGRISGRDVENWAQAESEIRAETGTTDPKPRRAIVIKINGVQYVGEYRLDSSDGYHPGEFEPGAPIPVRFDDDKMFVTRPDGRELETTIVKKIG
ncbi:MAG TPA: DUF2934 domain-containing protein [Candidatus Sulfotelmatobacter sp.]|nr:DUF2934 domain-containing protein [Candidatus Sulfotelmatobacter sp.]